MNDFSKFTSMLEGALAVNQKKQKLDAASQQKRARLEQISPNDLILDHADGDTFQVRGEPTAFRVSSGDPSKTIDTWESSEWALDERSDGGPERLESQKRALAKIRGISPRLISKQDIIDYGRVQAEETKAKLQDWADKGELSIRRQGTGAKGRGLVEVINSRTGENFYQNMHGREQNASYDSKYNAGQRLEDLFSGERAEFDRGRGPRSWKAAGKDQIINALYGAGGMVNDLTHAAAIIGQVNTEGVDKFFENRRDDLDTFKEKFNSPQQQRRERISQDRQVFNEKLFKVNVDKYMAEGDTETQAKIKAGLVEYGDTIKTLVQNPGRVLDATFESLPYMIGIGIGGRVVNSVVEKNLIKKTLKEVKGDPKLAVKKLQDFYASDAGKTYMRNVSERTGTTLVGLTEGLSNGAEVYSSVVSMSEEDAMQSEKYQTLRFDEGLSHREALVKLGDEAFIKTAGPGIILAGAASKVTGAGGWEARLFTTKGTLADKAKGATKAVATKSLTRKAAKAIGSQAKKQAGPGTREFFEESMQSGGGEFLAQLATHEITGKEVGSGIGAATAEGGVVGFAAGTGMSATTSAGKGAVKSLGKGVGALSDKRGKGFETAKRPDGSLTGQPKTPDIGKVPVTPTSAPSGTEDTAKTQPGGSRIVAVNTYAQKASQKGYDPVQEVQNLIKEIKGKEASPLNFEKYNEMREHLQHVIRNNPDALTSELRAEVASTQEAYVDLLALEVDNILKRTKSDEELTGTDKAILDEFIEVSSTIPDELTQGELGKKLNMAQEVANTITEMEIANTEFESANQKNSEKTIEKVNQEKFGRGYGKNGPGLQTHVDGINEAINNNDRAAYKQRDGRLGSFIASQKKKIRNMEKAIADNAAYEADQALPKNQQKGVQKSKWFYPPSKDNPNSGTVALLAHVVQETAQMEKIRNTLAKSFEAWNGSNDVTKQVIKNTTPVETTEKKAEPVKAKKAKKQESNEVEPIPSVVINQYKMLEENIAYRTDLIQMAESTHDRITGYRKNAERLAREKIAIEKYKKERTEMEVELQEIIDKFPGVQEAVYKIRTQINKARQKVEAKARQRPALTINDKLLADIKKMSVEELRRALYGKKKKLENYNTEYGDMDLYGLIDSERIAIEREIESRENKPEKAKDPKPVETTEKEAEPVEAKKAEPIKKEEKTKKDTPKPKTSKVEAKDTKDVEPLELEGSGTKATKLKTKRVPKKQQGKAPKQAELPLLVKAYKGTNFEAYQMPDGKWQIRERANTKAQWTYRIADKLGSIGTDGAAGLTPITTENLSGAVRINGKTYQIAQPITKEERKSLSNTTVIPKLLKFLARLGGLDKNDSDFERLKESGYKAEVGKPLFTEGGMDADSLLEKLVENEYLVEPNPDGVAELTTNDALEYLEDVITSYIEDGVDISDPEYIQQQQDEAYKAEYERQEELARSEDTEQSTEAQPKVETAEVSEATETEQERTAQEQLQQILDERNPPDNIWNDSDIPPAVTQMDSSDPRGSTPDVGMDSQEDGSVDLSQSSETVPQRILQTVGELRRLIRHARDGAFKADADGFFQREDIHISIKAHQDWIMAKLASGFTIEQAALALLNGWEGVYGKEALAEPESMFTQEEQQQLIDIAIKIQNGETVESITQQMLDDSIDLVNDEKWASKLRRIGPNAFNATFGKLQTLIKERFLNEKTPTTAKEVFKTKSVEVKQLYSAVPNLLLKLNDRPTRDKFYAAIKLSPVQEAAFDEMIDFSLDFFKANRDLAVDWDIESSNNPFQYKYGAHAPERFMQYVLQYFYDKDGKLNANFLGAMALEGFNYVTTNGPSTLHNDDETINKLIGRNPYAGVSPQEREAFSRGSSKGLIAKQIGRAVIQQMNLTKNINNDLDPFMLDRLEVSVGNMVLATLTKTNHVEHIPIPLKVFLEARKKGDGVLELDEALDVKDGTVTLIANRVDNFENGTYKNSRANERLRRAHGHIHKITSELFSLQPHNKFPSKKMPTKAPTRVARGNTAVPARLQKRILKMSQRSWKADKRNFEQLSRWDKERFLQFAAGTLSDAEIENTVHDINLVSVKSKNAANERAYDYAMEWFQNEGDSDFWFDYKVISTHRIYLDINTINPQAITMHRFLFRMHEWAVDVSTNPKTDEEITTFENFQIAIAQGLGIDISNNTRGEILRQFNEILLSEEFNAIIEILQQPSTEPFTEEEMELIGTFIKDREGTHTLVALQDWADYTNATGLTYTTTIPVETDGKTNGFAAGALQTPGSVDMLSVVKRMLNATGVYFDTDEDLVKNYPEFAALGKTDNYEDVASGTFNEIVKLLKGEVTELETNPNEAVGSMYTSVQVHLPGVAAIVNSGFAPTEKEFSESVGRNFAKSPLTKVSYGASMFSNRESVANDALAKFYKQLGEAGKNDSDGSKPFDQEIAEAIADVINRAYKVINAAGAELEFYSADDVINEANRKGITVKKFGSSFKLDETQTAQFKLAINAVYGHAMQVALEEKMKPFTAIRMQFNEAVFAMNAIFTADFKRRIARLEELSPTGIIGNDERRNLLNQMIREGVVPLVKSPLSESQLDSLEFTSDGTILLKGLRGEAQFNKPEQLGQQKVDSSGELVEQTEADWVASSGTTLNGYEPNTEIGVAAVVGATHSTDGAVNSEIFGSHAVLHVHDATMGGINDVDSSARTGNKAFYSVQSTYNMGQEIFDSLFKMMTLLSPTDSRLDGKTLDAIYIDIRNNLAKYNKAYENVNGAPKEIFESWFNSFQTTIQKNNEAREALFKAITYVNQFAKDGSEYKIEKGDLKLEETPASVITKFKDINEAIQASVDSMKGRGAENKNKTIKAVIEAIQDPDGDPGKPLFRWMGSSRPKADEVIDVLFRSYISNTPGVTRKSLVGLVNLLRPHLSDVTIKLGGVNTNSLDPEAAAQYSPLGNSITVDPSKSTNILMELLHEMVHAATYLNLRELQKTSPNEFLKINREAKEARNRLKQSKDPVALKAVQTMDAVWGKDAAEGISELLAYQFGTVVREGGLDTASRFPFIADVFSQTEQNLQDFQLLAAATQNPRTGETPLYNMGEDINQILFNQVPFKPLTVETAQTTYDMLNQHGQQLDPETKAFFDKVLESLVIPGLRSMDDLIYKFTTNPNGTKNVGKYVAKEVYLEASGNYLTNNVDMTLQEVGLHEIVHAILEHALNNNSHLRAEAMKLFKQARDGGNGERAITWQDFMPAQSGNNTAVDEALAKERYAYIFENVDGNVQLHEFMAIALTNPAFALALTQVTNPSVTKPNYEGGVLRAFVNLFRKALHWLTGSVNKATTTTLSDSLQELAGNIIAANTQHYHRSAQQYKQNWFNKLDDKAVAGIAEKILEPLKEYSQANRVTSAEARANQVDMNAAERVIDNLKNAAISGVGFSAEGFRQAFNDLTSTIHKDHPVWQIINEVMPWADENLDWIDMIRKSDRLLDMVRQGTIEHVRSIIHKIFDPKSRAQTRAEREAITNTVIKTDLSSLIRGSLAMSETEILGILNNKASIGTYLNRANAALRTILGDHPEGRKAWTNYNIQSDNLALVMIEGDTTIDHQMMNAHSMALQKDLSIGDRVPINNIEEVEAILEHIITLKAVKLTDQSVLDVSMPILNHEANRGDPDNGFSSLLGMHLEFKDLSLQKNFHGNKMQTIKGYMYEVLDEDIEFELVLNTLEERSRMERRGFKLKKEVEQSDLIMGPKRLLYVGPGGLSTMSASVFSFTSESKRGGGLFDAWDEYEMLTPKQAAKEMHKKLRIAKTVGYRRAKQQQAGNTKRPGAKVIPLLDDEGNIVDYRYMMNEKDKKSILKKRDYIDEVFPRMMASIEDRVTTKELNREAVDLLKKEYDEGKDNEDIRFIVISPNTSSEKGREMWNLMPMDTKQAMRDAFGGNRFYIRDDVVNLVLGFRKLTISDRKFLGPTAPVVRIGEKIWQEIIQWERFKIAVLNPVVSIGNIISNVAMLLSQRIPAKFIKDKSFEAIVSMRAFQKDVRARDELKMLVASRIQRGVDATKQQAELARIEAQINNNPVKEIVDEGLFTGIVEEYGIDESSWRRKTLGKLSDKITGAVPTAAINVAKEVWMVPGSKTAEAAMIATQYGDFVARYVKYNWDMNHKNQDMPVHERKRKAIHDSLSTFIYYNIPQNEYLQWANDNGFLMFTKFFTRTQHIIARVFSQNPIAATGVFGAQLAVGNEILGENIAHYAFLKNLTNKFKSPTVHLDSDILKPSILQWFAPLFWGDD